MYDISGKNLKLILNSIISLIKENKKNLIKLSQIDNEVNEFDFDIDVLISTVNKYKEFSINDKNGKYIFVSHYGNPYITTMLCIEAMLNKFKVCIGIDDICYGLNKAIIKIINSALKNYNIKTEFELKNNFTNSEIAELKFDKILCLGNANSYMYLRKISNVEVINVPLYDLNLYYDSEKYENLVESIRQVALKNFYEIEIFDKEENYEDVIYMINNGLKKYCSIILSEDKEKQNNFKKSINSEIICINENPFNKFKVELPNEIWK